MGSLVAGGKGEAVQWEVLVRITHIAPGGAWGEEAECHASVSLRREGGQAGWTFRVIGYSGSTWAEDRIQTAVDEAAIAAVRRITGYIEGRDGG